MLFRWSKVSLFWEQCQHVFFVYTNLFFNFFLIRKNHDSSIKALSSWLNISFEPVSFIDYMIILSTDNTKPTLPGHDGFFKAQLKTLKAFPLLKWHKTRRHCITPVWTSRFISHATRINFPQFLITYEVIKLNDFFELNKIWQSVDSRVAYLQWVEFHNLQLDISWSQMIN